MLRWSGPGADWVTLLVVPPPISVTLKGIVTLVRLRHPENADSPRLVTLEGIVTLVNNVPD